ncbi:hypothetical protein [Niallia sp. Krafla_26]|uniref:hypothetical protein n=1 Tax=Niallia sp. Krafla_26 TaxID=3064703 RepID=UPI003D187177
MKGRPIRLDYQPSETEGITGLKKKEQKQLKSVLAGDNSGTSITLLDGTHLFLEVMTDEEIITIDVREDILAVFNRKNLGGDFYIDLFSSMPQYVELKERNGDFKLSKSSLEEWKSNYETQK